MNIFTSKYYLFLLTILLSFTCNLFGQNMDLSCDTETSLESIEYFKSIKTQINKYENEFSNMASKYGKNKNALYSIPIKAHIIRTSVGTGGLSISDLNEAIANINNIYADSFIQFYISDDINYIDNDTYCHFNKRDEKSLTNTYNVKAQINIYFIDNLKNTSNKSICGYTNNNKNSDVILMKNSCVTNGSSLAHEIGHFFSLIHTHGIGKNLTTELVNGENCDTDGDGICDTPADPKLSYNSIDKNCNYTEVKTDANGDIFTPDTDNIMSYSKKSCRTHVSKQQLARIFAYYKSAKSYLGDPDSDYIEEEATIKNIKIYPNPISNNALYISRNNSESKINYQISNLIGQVFLSGEYNNSPINVSYLSTGTYLLTITNGKSRVTKKFIK